MVASRLHCRRGGIVFRAAVPQRIELSPPQRHDISHFWRQRVQRRGRRCHRPARRRPRCCPPSPAAGSPAAPPEPRLKTNVSWSLAHPRQSNIDGRAKETGSRSAARQEETGGRLRHLSSPDSRRRRRAWHGGGVRGAYEEGAPRDVGAHEDGHGDEEHVGHAATPRPRPQSRREARGKVSPMLHCTDGARRRGRSLRQLF